ncbi:MAG: OmpA family protein [Pedobacter sp.]|nr:MAG: OmpA family protein [Pedobacter sp.]
MKQKLFKSLSTALAAVCISTGVQAQVPTASRFSTQDFSTWSLGVHGGLLTPRTIFGNQSHQFQTPNEGIGYGGYIKKQILPAFGLQADFLAGKTGELRRANGVGGFTANSGYQTKIQWSGALTAVFNVANININQEHGVLVPYVKAGAGYMSSGATTTGFNDPSAGAGSYRESWFVPVGAGFKLGISRGINLDFGYDVNFVKSGKFDGMNGNTNDRFAYAHAGLQFSLGRKGKPQLQNHSSLAALRIQSKEESEELRRALSTAEQNAARDREQYAKDMADNDGDGVANKFDKCPDTPTGTVVDGSGCPLKVPAPQITERVTERVIVTEADRKVVADAIANLEFDLGKATIRSKSYTTLNRVAALLMEKNFSLKLAGHTDNTGSDALNLRLSKDRAESVKAYLVSQGANASRIEAVGFGKGQPIASNNTAEGRQQNRRVEFTLY